MIYLELFWEFFKTGLFSIGGGLATIPFLYNIAERYDWLDAAIIPDMIAISEATPGPIGINMATYTGFTAAGIPGALTATFSIILPSVIIIVLIAKLLVSFKNDVRVLNLMYGIRPASLGLITAAIFSVVQMSLLSVEKYMVSRFLPDIINIKAMILFVILLVVRIFFKKIHPVVYIAAAAVTGIIFKF